MQFHVILFAVAHVYLKTKSSRERLMSAAAFFISKESRDMAGSIEEHQARATAGVIPVFCAFDKLVSPLDLVGNPRNPNQHPEEQIKLLAHIIQNQGWRAPITVSNRSGFVVRGHGRLAAALLYNAESVPVDYQNYRNEADEWADLIADNRIAELAVINETQLSNILAELTKGDIDLGLTGYTVEQVAALIGKYAGEENADEKQRAVRLTLQQKFIVPPFSILDARAGMWGERKKAWRDLGIKSEIGRGNDGDKSCGGLTFSRSSQPSSTYEAKNDYEAKLGKKITWEEFAKLFPQEMTQGGTSIFDPVLCEVVYRWFCPQMGTIIDPFAGGSVRGIVAALTGRHYTGIDISTRQIDANITNWHEIIDKTVLTEANNKAPDPRWINGDSMNIQDLAPGAYDFLFTCPPYANLEIYSDAPEDISNKDYPEFLRLYRQIILQAASLLKSDRFACIVVGEVRDKNGIYYNFISDTIKAFIDAGLRYYNEAIFVMPFGSLPIRIGKQFKNSRKIGKTHQNVLVFVKGDPKKAAADIGTPEIEADLADIDNGEILNSILGTGQAEDGGE